MFAWTHLEFKHLKLQAFTKHRKFCNKKIHEVWKWHGSWIIVINLSYQLHSTTSTQVYDILILSGASSLEKKKEAVCRKRSAFDIIFQHKATLSLKTRNWPMNFALLPKYYIVKILPIYSISAIFAHKSRYANFLHRVFKNPSCYFIYD